MQFTPAQLAALARDRHMVVTANAGAGKTGVLTERYLRIVLDDDVDLSKVVAITFTNKAAAEMRARVGRKLRERIADPATPASIVARARRVLGRISTARISTFHAFCGSILRSFADEAGLDADMREILPREAAAKQRDAVLTVIRAWMQDGATRDRLLHALDEMGPMGFESAVTSLVGSGEALRSVRQWRGMHVDARSAIDARVGNALHIMCRSVHVHLRLAVQALEDFMASGRMKGTDLHQHVDTLADITELLGDADIASIGAAAQTVSDVLGVIYTDKGELRRKFVADKDVAPSIATSVLKQCDRLRDPSAAANMEYLQMEVHDVVLGVATDASEIYARSKADEHALDFDDLMLRTLDLLTQQPHVAADVRRNIVHLMVDEFQDTNPTQYELVRTLVPDLDATAQRVDHCPLLFVVGDAKQSIYGFRAADVRLFDRATAEIESANARRGWTSGRVPLTTSFRMAPGCAQAINVVCDQIMVKHTDFDVLYEHIDCARLHTSDDVGSMSMIITDGTEAAEEGDGSVDAECRHLAKVVARIADGTTPYMIEDDGIIRPAHAGDLAILVRKGADAMTLSGHLRTAGVPHQVLGGRGFFSRPEVADIRNLLRWATDPLDDLALLALLRSPILRCTDNDLYHIACMGQGAMWERALRARLHDESSDHLRTAVEHLQRFHDDIRVLPLPTFIREALSRTQWYATVGTDARREQILANVDKLIDLVRDASRDGLATVRDVVRSIDVPDRDTEAEQQYAVDSNAVRIMTFHAAKGLEFPIVILACISTVGGSDRGAPRMSDQLGMTFTLSETIYDRTDPTRAITRGSALSHHANGMIDADRDLAEQRRLIYVGLTRARDHVLVSMQSDPRGLAELLLPAMPSDTRTWVDDGAPHTYHAAPQAPRDTRRLDASLVDMVTIDMVSATELLTPALLDEEPSALTIAEEIGDAHGAAYGTVMHFLLQHGVATLTSTTRDERAEHIAKLLDTRVMSNAARDAALDEALRVLDAPLLRERAQELTSAMLETSLTASLDGVTIYGVMDALLHTSAHGTEVWDWKTTVVSDLDHLHRVADSYMEQMRVYAWLCLRTDAGLAEVTTRLLFTKAVDRLPQWTVERTWKRADLDEITSVLRAAIRTLTQRRAVRAGLLRVSA